MHITTVHYIYIIAMPFILLCRNEAYQAHIQLVVLDNSAHCLREQACNKVGTAIHACKFRKQRKKWDVTPVKKGKEYSYMNQIIEDIEKQRQNSCQSPKKKQLLPVSHPYHIQHTIGNSDPHSTSAILQNKRSQFTYFY